jgi:LacI family transcriptional regulator
MARSTLADLAREAGVSVATVDRVLNRRHPVRRETAQRVLAAAEASGYHATGLIRQRLEQGAIERKLGFVLLRSTPFYRALGAALADATRSSLLIRGKPILEFLDDLTPRAVSERLLQMGTRAHAVGLVAADHPNVTQAIDQLQGRGVPTFALISDLTAGGRAGYIGLDNRKVGRTAAWTIARLCRTPGKVGIVVGSHRYLCQELCEISFRAYFREHAPEFRVLEPLVSLEDLRLAHEATLALLRRHPDLVGLYVAGGGIEGVVEALREDISSERIVTICHDLTEPTRAGLIDGVVDLVISHPLAALAERTVAAMARALGSASTDGPNEILLPFDLSIAENV